MRFPFSKKDKVDTANQAAEVVPGEPPRRMLVAPPALIGRDGPTAMAEVYMQALGKLMELPFVKQYLHQVAELYLTMADGQQIQFWTIEFRAGRYSAMVWRIAEGDWAAGEWRECDTETPEYISIAYFVDRPVADSLEGILPILNAMRPPQAA